MPTIDELPPAISVSDTDEMALSQAGITRSATRAQLLAGLQPALAIPTGTLLGRRSAGFGAPETIALGANLTFAQGALSAPAAFTLSSLSSAVTLQSDDLVAVAQGGENVASTYGQFMVGLAEVAGIDGSSLLATVQGAPAARRIGDLFSDAVTIESFGAVGDGATDDTAAFVRALASGQALVLGCRVYVVDGALVAGASVAMTGVRGATVLRRLQGVVGGPWLSITGPTCVVSGVTFDAGGLAGHDAPCVQVAASCVSSIFVGCAFLNCAGPTAGSGLSLACGADSQHMVRDCLAQGNGLHGVSATGSGSFGIVDSVCQRNAGCGIAVDVGVSAAVSRNTCWQNQQGISVGNWTFGGAPGAAETLCVVADNVCLANTQWGLAISASGAAVTNQVSQGNGTSLSGGGVLARLSSSRVSGLIVEGGSVGLDCRASSACLFSGCHISLTGFGILAGGCNNVRIGENFLIGNGWGIMVSGIEPSVSLSPTSTVTVERNWIGFSTPQSGGISVRDGAQGIAVVDNTLSGSGSAFGSNALWIHTDSAIVLGNSWNNTSQYPVQAVEIGGQAALVLPEVADDVLVTSAPPVVTAILTQHQVDTLGQVSFLKVTEGGSGYTTALVSISGSGTGALAQAVISAGRVVWLIVTNPGSGYGGIGASVQVTIAGDGTGAAGIGFVGLPVIDGRRLRLTCTSPIRLVETGSMPPLSTWTGYDTSIPAGGAVELEGVFGGWRAVQSPPVDYLLPTGDGGAIVQSVGGGNLMLRPAPGGSLTIASAGEPAGYASCLGRGSPEGVVVAGPGSDFRNLDGGNGNTLWVKLSGTDSSGWTAIA